MENVEIANVLEELADLLEVEDENPFKVRAYRTAARTVLDHPTPLRCMLEEGADLTELPGIGKEIAAKIAVLVRTGSLPQLEAVRARVPRTLLELMRLPGVGAKKAAKLHRELGIATIDELERAAREGKVAQLPGFGAKSEGKILTAIADRRRQQGRVKLVDADSLVVPLLEHLRAAPGLTRLEVAGSWRRRRETVGDLDLLGVTDEPGPVMQHFLRYPAVVEVLAAGDTRGSVVLRSGLQVDLRLLPAESFGAALMYFTGSKAHNIHLRKRALEQGCTLSEYGLFRLGEGAPPGSTVIEQAAAGASVPVGPRIAGREEQEVFAALGLPFIPPELREDRGEIELAAQGKLPRLITLGDLRGDLQMHSTWSDGKQSLEQMVQACEDLGYEYLAITDHSKALAMIGGLDAARLARQAEEVAAVQARHPRIRILRSMEVDILVDGSLDLEEEALATLDVVLVSVHSRFDLPPAQQTERILRAVRHPRTNILGHPTGRLLHRREPMSFDLDEVLRVAAELGVAVECNAHPDRLDLKDLHLQRARELGARIVIDTDAHNIHDLGMMRYGVDQARRAGLEPQHVLNTLPLDALLAALRRR